MPLIALFDGSDRHHVDALAFLKRVEGKLITNFAVVTETTVMLGPAVEAQTAFLGWASRALEIDLGEKVIGYTENFDRGELRSVKVTHAQVPGSLAGFTAWVQSTRSSRNWGFLSRRNWMAAAQSPLVAKKMRPE